MKKANTSAENIGETLNTEEENNGATLIQEQPKIYFKIIYQTIYERYDFTIDEWGLLHRLIYAAPTFKPTKKKLMTLLKISEKRLIKASKGLQEKGFLKIKKFGNNSEWIITQEPIKNNIKDLSKESIINALIDYKITFEDVDRLHKLKYIDDRLFSKIGEEYAKEVIKLTKIDIYNKDE